MTQHLVTGQVQTGLIPADLAGLSPIPTACLCLAAGGALAVAYGVGRRRRAPAGEGVAGGSTVDTMLTVAAAGIATVVAVSGMWRVFRDVLGVSGTGLWLMSGFLEIALLVSAIRARANVRLTGRAGVDGTAVWVIAVISAVVAASHEQGMGWTVRLAAPLLAAWLWHRGMAVERKQARSRQENWGWADRVVAHLRERLLVQLGLSGSSMERTAVQMDRHRRLARLTRARLQLAKLEDDRGALLALLTLRAPRRMLAVRRLERQAFAAVEHLGLGMDSSVPVAIQSTVAAVVGLRAATDAGALGGVSPWQQQRQPGSTCDEVVAVVGAAGAGEAAADVVDAVGAGADVVDAVGAGADVVDAVGAGADVVDAVGAGADVVDAVGAGDAAADVVGTDNSSEAKGWQIPDASTWEWWCQERAAGRTPSEVQVAEFSGKPRSTAGRWRRNALKAEADGPADRRLRAVS